MSPVDVTFCEVGAIPPPRMFSDSNTITLSIRSDCGEGARNGTAVRMEVDGASDEAKGVESSSGDSLSPVVTVIRDDESTKEPLDASAVPKKSALRKSRVSAASLNSQPPSNGTSSHASNGASSSSSSSHIPSNSFSLPLPSDRYVFSFAPRPPAAHSLLNQSTADSDDSDSEESINWRDYYGDDERGEWRGDADPEKRCL